MVGTVRRLLRGRPATDSIYVMPTRLSLFAVLLLVGCGRQPQEIRIGQTGSDAVTALEANAANISGRVGIVAGSPHRLHWYVLDDGTCVQLTTSPGVAGDTIVSNIILGESGAGYGGKMSWFNQQQTKVESLLLP